MVPTLGQGATQSVEDACVAAQVITRALAAGSSLEPVPGQVEALRLERVRFAADFSREATDTMLEGADPVAGTLKKLGPSSRPSSPVSTATRRWPPRQPADASGGSLRVAVVGAPLEDAEQALAGDSSRG